MAVKLAQDTADALAAAVNTLTNTGGAGKITVYDAGSQPATGDTDISAATPLVEFTLETTAFTLGVGTGKITLQGVPLTEAALTSGNAVFFRMTNGAGDPVLDGSVGLSGSGAQLILNTVSITSGVNVTITSGEITMPTA